MTRAVLLVVASRVHDIDDPFQELGHAIRKWPRGAGHEATQSLAIGRSPSRQRPSPRSDAIQADIPADLTRPENQREMKRRSIPDEPDFVLWGIGQSQQSFGHTDGTPRIRGVGICANVVGVGLGGRGTSNDDLHIASEIG
jgi:hypothetical protein